MKKRTNELKKDGHIVSVFYDSNENLFLSVDGVFYQILLNEYENNIIRTNKPVTPMVALTELPKEYQPMFVGYDC